MIRLHKIIASTIGIGYIGKGGGTVAALFAILCWYLFIPALSAQLAILGFVMVLGVWSGNKVETDWGKDNKKVVIDEVAGMCISLLAVPVAPVYLLIAFLLFRFFDIAKPLGIRQTEKLPGGWGVMADDVLAGIYTRCVLQLILYFNLI